MCHVCKLSQKWSQGPEPKRDIFARTKNKKQKLQGLKLKRVIFAGTKIIF